MSHKIIGQIIKKVVHLNEQVLILLDNDEVICLYPRRVEYSNDDYVQEMDVHNVKDLKYELKYELGLITEEEMLAIEMEELERSADAFKQNQLDTARRIVKYNGFTAEEIFNS